jgi:hypothetical protein
MVIWNYMLLENYYPTPGVVEQHVRFILIQVIFCVSGIFRIENQEI